MLIEFILVAASVFLLTVILEKIIIPILKSHKVGQRILEIGPRWHQNKSGTPTMGGICFILPTKSAHAALTASAAGVSSHCVRISPVVSSVSVVMPSRSVAR